MKKNLYVIILVLFLVGCGKKEVTFEKKSLYENNGAPILTVKTSLLDGTKGTITIDYISAERIKIDSFRIYDPVLFTVRNGEIKIPLRTKKVLGLMGKISNGEYEIITEILPENQTEDILKKYGRNFNKLNGKFVKKENSKNHIQAQTTIEITKSNLTAKEVNKKIISDKKYLKSKIEYIKWEIENFFENYPTSGEIRNFNIELQKKIKEYDKYLEAKYPSVGLAAFPELIAYSLAFTSQNEKDVEWFSKSIDDYLNNYF